jgi:hypothetical protein
MQKRLSSFENELRRYMLGQMTQQDEGGFDQRLMTASEDLHQEMCEIAEVLQDELVEDYLSNNLSQAEEEAFEHRLLRSRIIGEKLLLDKALRVNSARKENSLAQRIRAWLVPVLTPALVAVYTTVLLMAGGWLVYRISQLQVQLDATASREATLTVAQETLQSEVKKERLKSEALTQELAFAKSSASGAKGAQPSFAMFVLRPGSNRGSGQTTRISIASGQALIELRLDIGSDMYPSYRAALNDSADSELMLEGKLRAVSKRSGVYVPVQVPAQMLRPDDYQMRLSGERAGGGFVMIDSYTFRVVRP